MRLQATYHIPGYRVLLDGLDVTHRVMQADDEEGWVDLYRLDREQNHVVLIQQGIPVVAAERQHGKVQIERRAAPPNPTGVMRFDANRIVGTIVERSDDGRAIVFRQYTVSEGRGIRGQVIAQFAPNDIEWFADFVAAGVAV